jgi:hypothetical protein
LLGRFFLASPAKFAAVHSGFGLFCTTYTVRRNKTTHQNCSCSGCSAMSEVASVRWLAALCYPVRAITSPMMRSWDSMPDAPSVAGARLT